MGEVYRARDTTLNRDVALKILPAAFASDPDRLARFTREAQTLAALNHPNIAAIYGIEAANASTDAGQETVRALVMELVDGDDLSPRIAIGAIPLEEVLPIARQIADALEAAHEAGIVHRDLKPANIKVRPDGTVKVLDFGLAKAIEGPGASGKAGGVSMSPTLSLHATLAGVILGTAAYMSPEQARGRAVDRRADIWAFGVVLYEMLAGRRAFEGDDISSTIASVLKDEVSWQALPADLPASIRRLLRRCLEKDPKRRLSAIGDARLELDEAGSAVNHDGVLAPPALTAAAVPAWRRALPWAVAGTFGIALVAAMLVWAPWRMAAPARAARVSVDIGAGVSLSWNNSGSAAILSPDGSVLAFIARKSVGGPQMYVRRLDQLQASMLAGIEDAASPFFSPDGQWLAFFANGKLKKVSVTGGGVVTLCDVPAGRGGTWADDDTIIYSPANTPGVTLMRVSAAGGTPDRLTTIEQGEVTQRFPQILAGGKAVLFMSHNTTGGYEDANIIVQPLPSGPRKVIVRGGYYGRYVSSGHLLYVHGGTLFAAPFDLNRLELAGQPVPVVEGIASGPGGGAQFATSLNGTLVYEPGEATGGEPGIEWMDRDGKTTTLRSTPANWSDIMFAPDGRRLAVDIAEASASQADIWVYEWARDTLSRLTLDPANDVKPVWTPDGRRIAFSSQRNGGVNNLYWQRADGTGDVQRLTTSKNIQYPASGHPSGKLLAFYEQRPQTDMDLMVLPLEGNEVSGWKPGEPRVLLSTVFVEREPMFSPDGRWLAYVSNKTGSLEVYVRSFPGPGGEWQVSTGGGSMPTWSRSRGELFYAGIDNRIMVSGYAVEGDAFRADKPRIWSDVQFRTRPRNFLSRSFDLHPDGQRFAIAKLVTGSETQAKLDRVVLVFNFFDELRRLAPATRGR